MLLLFHKKWALVFTKALLSSNFVQLSQLGFEHLFGLQNGVMDGCNFTWASQNDAWTFGPLMDFKSCTFGSIGASYSFGPWVDVIRLYPKVVLGQN